MAPFAGASVSAWYVSFISDRFGWKHSSIGIFVACLIQSLLNLLALPTSRNDHSKKCNEANRKTSLRDLLKIEGVKEIVISVFFLKFARYVLYMWLPMYLSQWFGFPMATSGYLSSSFYIGAVLGGPVLGLFVEKCNQE